MESCTMGCTTTAKYFLQRLSFDDTQRMQELFIQQFRNVCIRGNVKLAKAIHKKMSNLIHLDLNYYSKQLFMDVCKNGYLSVAKWLFQCLMFSKIIYRIIDEKLFIDVCCYGHLNMAKWLLQKKPNLEINAFNHFAFLGSCNNGNLHVAKWLLKINPLIDIHDYFMEDYYGEITRIKNYAFVGSVDNRQVNVSKHLMQINPKAFYGFIRKRNDGRNYDDGNWKVVKTKIYSKKIC